MLPIIGKATTMIGSMPQAEPSRALEALSRHPLTIPVWPQLPKRSFREWMIPQYAERFPGIRFDDGKKSFWVEQDGELPDAMAVFFEKIAGGEMEYFALSDAHAAGFQAFSDACAARGRKYPIVKGQVTGPFTFGLGLTDRSGKPVYFDDLYQEAVVNGLAQSALWQCALLERYADHVVIFFDEPIISALGTPAYMGVGDETVIKILEQVVEPLQKRGASVGVHCCGNADWGLLAKSGIDIISFDAYSFAERVALYRDEIAAFLERGGTLAWGIVPTDDPAKLGRETPHSLSAKLARLRDHFAAKGIPRAALEARALITPSCGMGNLPLEDAEKVLALLEAIG